MIASLVTIGGGTHCMRAWIEANAFDGEMYVLVQFWPIALRILDGSP
jgi:hypothetical protein